MGYSYAAKAGLTLDALATILRGKCPSSNSIEKTGGFWEYGREQADGAITGTVVKPWKHDPEKVVKAGTFRIEPDGTITRFPGATKEERMAAESVGAEEYRKRYGSDT
jgi:hypothetical protein